ncbi:MAG: cytochrome c peroxidase [Verrucomicrobiales bacterium]
MKVALRVADEVRALLGIATPYATSYVSSVKGNDSTSNTCLMNKVLLCLVFALSIGRSSGQEKSSVLTLSFRHVVDGRPLLMNSLRYRTSAEDSFSVSRLSYLLTRLELEQENGKWLTLKDQVAWIDLGQRRTRFSLNLAPGKFRSLKFHIGPDAETNAADTASFPAEHPLNPNVNGLHWSWQGGYIFLALEGRFRATGEESLSGFSYHLARDPNRPAVTIAADLDLTHSLTCEIDFDIASLLNAPQPLSFSKHGSSTHSHPGDYIAESLVKNLPGAFRVRRVASHAPSIAKVSFVKPLYLPASFTPYPFKISRSFPIPNLPRDNPLLQERVDLGRKLFHDPILSRDGSVSCASCHHQAHALADPRRSSVGIDDQTGTRNAMPLFNLAWKDKFFWDGRAQSLRAQALMPIEDHTEMDEKLDRVVSKLAQQGDYREAFARAFDSDAITAERIGLAIENFLLTVTSYRSKFDNVLSGKATFSKPEQRGFELFMTEYEPRSGRFGADCFHCHGGALFTDHQFHNNGLDDASAVDLGLYTVTGKESDKGRFSTPSLRNVELTAPYMHDGRLDTLKEVVQHYNSGLVRSPTLDANLAKHPASGLELSEEDVAALVAFLMTLTDDQFAIPNPN